MADMPSFVRLEGETVLFNGKDNEEMIAYIPEKYFDRNIAEIEGKYINLIGIFDYTIQNTDTGKNNGLKHFNFPSIFTTKPSYIEKVKDVQLTKNTEVMDYRIFHYRKDDEIIQSTKVVQFIGNCEKFMNLFFILGFIPNTIPYDKIQDYMVANANINGFDYEISMQLFGFIISEICRAKDDENTPFRLSGSNDLTAYKSMSIKNVSKLISPYTALISEDFDESVLHAMLNETPKDTPLETVLVGE